MKKLFFTVLAVIAFNAVSQAQEANNIKLNPLGLIIGSINMSYERAISDEFSLQINPGYWTGFEINGDDFTGFRIGAEGRYYLSKTSFAPDGFYVGPYTNYQNLSVNDDDVNIFSLGGEFGNQWVYDSGFVLDLNLGLGYASASSDDADVEADVGNFLPKLTLALGYNF